MPSVNYQISNAYGETKHTQYKSRFYKIQICKTVSREL